VSAPETPPALAGSPAPAIGDGHPPATAENIQLLLEACRRALRYAENVVDAEGVYFDRNNDLPFIEMAIAKVGGRQ
jgi:hypothetical protein